MQYLQIAATQVSHPNKLPSVVHIEVEVSEVLTASHQSRRQNALRCGSQRPVTGAQHHDVEVAHSSPARAIADAAAVVGLRPVDELRRTLSSVGIAAATAATGIGARDELLVLLHEGLRNIHVYKHAL